MYLQVNSSNKLLTARDPACHSPHNWMSQASLKIIKRLAVMGWSEANQLIYITAARQKHPLTHLFTLRVYTLVLNKAASSLCAVTQHVVCLEKELRSVLWREDTRGRPGVNPQAAVLCHHADRNLKYSHSLNMVFSWCWWVEVSCCEIIVCLGFSTRSSPSLSSVEPCAYFLWGWAERAVDVFRSRR